MKIICPDCGLEQEDTDECILCHNDYKEFEKAEKWWRKLKPWSRFEIYKYINGKLK